MAIVYLNGTVSELALDVAKMQDWKDGIVKKLTSGVRGLVKGNGGDIRVESAPGRGTTIYVNVPHAVPSVA